MYKQLHVQLHVYILYVVLMLDMKMHFKAWAILHFIIIYYLRL